MGQGVSVSGRRIANARHKVVSKIVSVGPDRAQTMFAGSMQQERG
jgi:hypothetical protein